RGDVLAPKLGHDVEQSGRARVDVEAGERGTGGAIPLQLRRQGLVARAYADRLPLIVDDRHDVLHAADGHREALAGPFFQRAVSAGPPASPRQERRRSAWIVRIAREPRLGQTVLLRARLDPGVRHDPVV